MAFTPDITRAKFDPQGHQMGPLGTLGAQLSLMLGLIWSFGALGVLELRPSYGVLTLLPVLGAILLAPRSVIMQIPVSLWVLSVFGVVVGSITWSVDPAASTIVLQGQLPAMLAIVLCAGLLSLEDIGDALVWTARIVVLITIFALITAPETRLHIVEDADNYPGWHGFFTHKNNLTPMLVMFIPTVLLFDKNQVTKLASLATIGVLVVGSNSATGISGAVLVFVAYIWLIVYQRQDDLRNRTLLMFVSILGVAILAIAAVASIATITSAYGKDTTFSGRTEIWSAVWDIIKDRPFIGHGYGGVFYFGSPNTETIRIWREVGFEAAHAHNALLDITLQLGLLGLILVLGLWFSTMLKAWRSLTIHPVLATWVIANLAANGLIALSEDAFSGSWIAIFAFMRLLLIRRPESLNRPSYRTAPITRWIQVRT